MKRPNFRIVLCLLFWALEFLLFIVCIVHLILIYPKDGRGIGYGMLAVGFSNICIGLTALFTSKWWWLLIAAAIGVAALFAVLDPHTWLQFLIFLPFLILPAAVSGLINRFAAKEIKQYLKERKEQKEETHPQDGEQTP